MVKAVRVSEYNTCVYGQVAFSSAFPVLTLLGVVLQLQWLPQIVEWAKTTKKLAGKLDWSLVATAGHSRGGKIAGLHYVLGASPQYVTRF